MYLTDVVSSVVTPNQFLAGFQKVFIPYVIRLFLGALFSQLPHFEKRAGSSETVTIQINSTELGLWSLDNAWIVEPGDFTVKIGTSNTTYLNATLTVTE